jgi:hypothetical protein
MDTRETATLKIGKHDFVVKTYATARETQAIQGTYFKGAKVSIAGGAPVFDEIDPAVQFEVEEETIRQLVVSIDGSTENIVETCKDLPNAEYRELISGIDELISKKNS